MLYIPTEPQGAQCPASSQPQPQPQPQLSEAGILSHHEHSLNTFAQPMESEDVAVRRKTLSNIEGIQMLQGFFCCSSVKT